jgi:type I restriction-modification system DNA methylase subunit
MAVKDFYTDLQYTDLLDVNTPSLRSELEEYRHLGIDKVYFSGDYPAIFFKEVSQFDEKALKEIAQVQHLAWNYRKVMFLFAVSPAEIKIYNCCKKPFNYDKAEINIKEQAARLEVISATQNDKGALQTVKELFSRIAVDSGIFWTSENELRKKVSIQERIDKYLVQSLLTTAKELKKSGLNDNVIHSLLMRSIFIMYLEDKGAAKETKLYSRILKDAQSYIDILKDKTATYALFKEVENHFNGNVFPIIKGEERQVTQEHLKIIKRCLTDGDLSDNPKLFEEWRLFRFDVIQIELLSEIYENFLEEFKELSKEEAGQYYTPPSLVELILNEKLKTKNEANWNTKILDPACGSGIFLVESFKRLVKRWKNANPENQIEFKDLREIVKNNIYGIELDKYAIRVAAFSIYLAIIEQLNPKTLWINKSYKFPYLINDPQDEALEYQGNNLFRADTIGDINPADFVKIDLVVGNPPFGAKIKLQSVKKFLDKYGYGKDLVIPFLRKAVEFTESGSVALIFNSKVLTNTEWPFQKFRHWLLNETYVEKIYNLSIFRKAPKTFGGQLFTSAVGPVSIVFYQKKTPTKPSPTIEYWAPKTYVKSNLVEGVIIDATDIKFLPREECQKSNTKIWKIAMWGTLEDFKFITKLNSYTRLKEFIVSEDINKALGLQFLDKSTKSISTDNVVSKLPYIQPGSIERYYTSEHNFGKLIDGLTEKSIEQYKKYYKLKSSEPLKRIYSFRRLGKDAKKAFEGPHILIKEGLSNRKLCASYIEESCSFNSKVLGINSAKKEILKSLTCYINSNLATYYLFLISASIGIEREEIKPNELYELPFHYEKDYASHLEKYLTEIKNLIKKNLPLKADISGIEKSINEEIFKMFKLSENERILISDFMTYTMGLMFDGNNSIALKTTNEDENYQYASILCKELNKFLGSNLNSSADIYSVEKFHPLNMVKLTLNGVKNSIRKSSFDDFNKYLSSIDKYLLKKEAKNIYIKKQLKYYDENNIYIIKPNQKRFWCRSMAINDSKELISEILKMEYSE